ncbi:hypothetical protein ACFSTJ_20190 [Ottowia pentelensis]|uniref:hypothetical protein n=1 Tax=Ottowia pentelensis TaxID=511108 RepID=UPI00363AE0EA
MGPDGERVFGALAVAGQGGGVLGPQFIHALAELLQAGHFVRGQGAQKALRQVLSCANSAP